MAQNLIILLQFLGALLFLAIPTDETIGQDTLPSAAPKKEQRDEPTRSPDIETLSPFLLHTLPLKVSLPDLRAHLIYYGTLSRPDNEDGASLILFGLRGQPEILHTPLDAPLFLQYDNERNVWKKASKSPLKLAFTPKEKCIEIAQEIELPNGLAFKEPRSLALFTLPLMPLPPQRQTEEISLEGTPVDQNFWESQSGVWWGEDVLYEALSHDMHKKQAQRVLLYDAHGSRYTLWVQEGDGFLYQNGRWTPIELGEESRKEILLYAREVSERSIDFELWSPNGTSRLLLPLSKKEAPGNEQPLSINLIGARSKNTWIATINGQRTLLRTDDWFLLKEGVLEKLESKTSLDNYIQGQQEGTLLAFSGIEKIGNEQKLMGISIDPTRTKSTPMAISLFHSWDSKEEASPKTNAIHGTNHHHDEDDEDDFDDEDLEDMEEDFLYDDE